MDSRDLGLAPSRRRICRFRTNHHSCLHDDRFPHARQAPSSEVTRAAPTSGVVAGRHPWANGGVILGTRAEPDSAPFRRTGTPSRCQLFFAAARPPLRPADLCCAVVPPCFDEPPEPDFLPPREDVPGEFAIRAARCFDIPLSLRGFVLPLVLDIRRLRRHGDSFPFPASCFPPRFLHTQAAPPDQHPKCGDNANLCRRMRRPNWTGLRRRSRSRVPVARQRRRPATTLHGSRRR